MKTNSRLVMWHYKHCDYCQQGRANSRWAPSHLPERVHSLHSMSSLHAFIWSPHMSSAEPIWSQVLLFAPRLPAVFSDVLFNLLNLPSSFLIFSSSCFGHTVWRWWWWCWGSLDVRLFDSGEKYVGFTSTLRQIVMKTDTPIRHSYTCYRQFSKWTWGLAQRPRMVNMHQIFIERLNSYKHFWGGCGCE